MRNAMRKSWFWWMPAAAVALSMLLLCVARRSDVFSEWYATAVYPVLVYSIGGLFGLIPFSVGEWVVYVMAAVALVFTARAAFCLFRRPRLLRVLLRRGLLVLTWTFSVLFLLYGVNCGVNYHRMPFSTFSGLTLRPSTALELAAFGDELLQETNLLAQRVGVLEDGSTSLSCSAFEVSHRARDAMQSLGETYPPLSGYYPPAKPVLFSRGMSRLDITGIYFPPTIEANINVDVPSYHIPATACHELSHLRGFMREDEANFIAYLACRASGDDDFRYSGNMLALVHVSNALYRADADLSSRLREQMSERVNADFRRNSEYWDQMEGPVATVSEAVNNTYLKANAQADGTKSYGRMVDLLLADYRLRYGIDAYI